MNTLDDITKTELQMLTNYRKLNIECQVCVDSFILGMVMAKELINTRQGIYKVVNL